MEFKDKVVVVTGAAQGIGKRIAAQFARAKAKVVLFDLDQSKLEAAKAELADLTECEFYPVNVTDFEKLTVVIDKVIDKFSKIDILVNNAGITKDSLALRLSEDDWDQVLEVNLKGAFLASKVVLKKMLKQRNGKIVNISSIIGIVGNPGQSNYSASKAGLIGLTKSLSKEVGLRGINVNAVAPGYIETKMTENLPDKVKEEMLKRISLKKFGSPKNVADAVLFLSSEAADYITGQVVIVDGGMI
ncbi:MAG: 3-oxoacyl-[acyl-carrier-protein] reductase [Candidatus Omnitrophica bacterium]|nr:3-oxoacyl-[acyl-carrier-protein] reductase [Candidatus Omnitrophota bacterium]MCF7877681.1 3-oxoacyl-[acyl-carrier-protein] reductase [Candidatus Omnitrophota bacterium]MCF7891719.1 3-oxoacyl-[acyl-carrier-protein] reductase [Candidatus Omnitrophota bacterium]MCF7898282.1 3-oxoacyl-[acyl-carrier-protein] reductase [Candidatus Omnitrophota bacterium]MCF7909101.1 3-oxoacyl-[acyl-carrier-protein] reductase [Candidatus Omnitrophota bacterium]